MIAPFSIQEHESGSSMPHSDQPKAPKPRLLDQVRDTIRRNKSAHDSFKI
jgi:hypothetical protein